MEFEGTGAEILVESLRLAGIDVLFGLPGDTGVAFYDALYRRADVIRHVLARDERSAAIMADAYARCTNRVGVVEASSGGGTTYVVGGLGEPYAASVPLLVLTSDIHRRSRGTGALTEIDQQRLFSAVTTWQARADAACEIPHLVATALTAATGGRPGPVSLVLPEDVLDERATVTFPVMNTTIPRERAAADPAATEQAAAAIGRARRPAVVVGSGVHLAAAYEELRQLAEAAGLPVATTIHGKGTFPDTNAWSLGVVGANGARPYANAYLAEADLVLFVGTRANSTDTNGFTSPPRAGERDVTVIQVDIEAERAGQNFPGSLALVGDAKVVLAQLAAVVAPAGAERREQLLAWLGEQRTAWLALQQRAPAVPPGTVAPDDLVRAVAAAAGPEATVIADPGKATPNVAAYWQISRAGRSVLIPRGHGAMGYAIPAAIGAAMARPGSPIIAFTGDGSFAMACGDLETACRLAPPIVYIHLRNGSFGWIKMLQRLYEGQRYFGVDVGSVDAVAVARGFGLEAVTVSSLEEFKGAFERALATGRPTFIDVPVPDLWEHLPPVAPWEAALAGAGERPVY
jgi:acetolactate synthase-1/2/3 large subunit